ncbi:hypothetical protein CERZMDRAFT_88288 [Cercospora zeae-maydis SCOH1-5]|uniref:Uncharacterized protein n=1 Tax=Cercospora zeae-maydis SCOH1-5 TaxID=717836 RepID=A0A6A6F305_9PEZI|nr:hypothetical protein CERZMDRAFT_88288 [Cercospora zeae-maydis SCOH1-5]
MRTINRQRKRGFIRPRDYVKDQRPHPASRSRHRQTVTPIYLDRSNIRDTVQTGFAIGQYLRWERFHYYNNLCVGPMIYPESCSNQRKVLARGTAAVSSPKDSREPSSKTPSATSILVSSFGCYEVLLEQIICKNPPVTTIINGAA